MHRRGAAPPRRGPPAARRPLPQPDWQHPLRDLVAIAGRGHRRTGLDVSSGSGHFSQAWRQRAKDGATQVPGCFEWDTRWGLGHDLTKLKACRLIRGWLRANMWLGTPCASWSMARRADGSTIAGGWDETYRVQNPDIPRTGRVGAHGGVAGRGWAGLGANRTVRLGDKRSSHTPKHRRHVA